MISNGKAGRSQKGCDEKTSPGIELFKGKKNRDRICQCQEHGDQGIGLDR